MSSVPVVAILRAKDGKESILEGILKDMVKFTHEEQGCVRYALHHVAGDKKTFVFVERWNSQKELDAHLGSAHISKAMERKDEIIASIDILPLVSIPVGKTSMESF